MSYLWATVSHRGRVRSHNEDRAFPEQGGRSAGSLLLVVADGMGGAAGGEVAASVAVEAAVTDSGGPAERVRRGNEAVLAEAWKRPALRGMGTTMTLADLSADGIASIAHVGDSRAYLLRGDGLRQLTLDHTVVAEELAAGRIRPEQVANHPQRSMLTRVLGLSRHLDVDVVDEPLGTGDRLLLCSDGLNSMLSDQDIAAHLSRGTPAEAAWRLVEEANMAGGVDNVTVIVTEVT